MDLKKIEDFINLAKKTGVSKLKYENAGEEFCVEFEGAHSLNQVSSSFVHQNYTQHAKLGLDNENIKGLKEITSPFVGTFYKSVSPQNPPFIKIGDRFSAGKVLCIVEAMKIMNEIEADCSGEIVEICVENETYVEYGQVLFKIQS